ILKQDSFLFVKHDNAPPVPVQDVPIKRGLPSKAGKKAINALSFLKSIQYRLFSGSNQETVHPTFFGSLYSDHIANHRLDPLPSQGFELVLDLGRSPDGDGAHGKI